jgi:CelD/BcsL family acetyltransferase involved in cellulose biosynthesis
MSVLSKPMLVRPGGGAMLAVALEPAFDFGSEEYQAIHQRSPASAFQEPQWLASLLRDVAPAAGAEPTTVTVRETKSRRLLLVLPLVRWRRGGVTYVEFADFGLCDYARSVYDPVDAPLLLADATLPERIAALLPRCDVVSLTKLPGDDPILDRLFMDGRQARMRLSAYPARLGADWSEWRSTRLDRSFRRYLDMKRRRTARTGTPAFSLVEDPDEITQLFDVLRGFRAERFKQLGVHDVIADEAVFAFYRRIAIEGAQSGTARTFCLSLSGEPVAVVFGLVHRRTFSLILVGFDILRHRRLSLGLLALEDTLRAAVEAGDKVYDFTIGDHPYKLQFGAEALPLYEWHAARSVRGHLAVLAIKLVREAKRILKPLVRRAMRSHSPASPAPAVESGRIGGEA